MEYTKEPTLPMGQTSVVQLKIYDFSWVEYSWSLLYACKTVAIIRIQQHKVEWKKVISIKHMYNGLETAAFVFGLPFSFDARVLFRLAWYWPESWFPIRGGSKMKFVGWWGVLFQRLVSLILVFYYLKMNEMKSSVR